MDERIVTRAELLAEADAVAAPLGCSGVEAIGRLAIGDFASFAFANVLESIRSALLRMSWTDTKTITVVAADKATDWVANELGTKATFARVHDCDGREGWIHATDERRDARERFDKFLEGDAYSKFVAKNPHVMVDGEWLPLNVGLWSE